MTLRTTLKLWIVLTLFSIYSVTCHPGLIHRILSFRAEQASECKALMHPSQDEVRILKLQSGLRVDSIIVSIEIQ